MPRSTTDVVRGEPQKRHFLPAAVADVGAGEVAGEGAGEEVGAAPAAGDV
jgi:hypothetical protein